MLILIAWPKCCLISLLCSTVFSPSIWLENTLKPCKFCVSYQNFLPAFIIHWWFLLELVFTTVVAKMVVFNFSTSSTECYQWIYSMARAPHSALYIHPPSTHLPIHLSVHLPITRMSTWISIFFLQCSLNFIYTQFCSNWSIFHHCESPSVWHALLMHSPLLPDITRCLSLVLFSPCPGLETTSHFSEEKSCFWRLEWHGIRNPDLDSRCAHCYWGVVATRPF